MTNYLHSPYLTEPFMNQKAVVKRAQEQLADVEFDALVGMGLSGSLIVPLLAFLMDKRFAIVRKKDCAMGHGQTSHGIESCLKAGDKWLFCDDFISSGATRRRVIRRMYDNHVTKVDYVGDYLYGSQGYTTYYFEKHGGETS